jgi:TonB family protein
MVLAATQLAAAEPQFMWLSNDDTPVERLAGREYAIVRIRVTVPPDGSVQDCETELSSGDPVIDALTCDLARKRLRFSPAVSEVGEKTYGVYRVATAWTLGERPEGANIDIRTTIERLPKHVHSPASVSLMFNVDERGEISGCAVEPRPGIPPANAQLGTIACEQLKASNYKPLPAKNKNGKLVPSVQTAVVNFIKR